MTSLSTTVVPDRPVWGIALMMAFCALAPLGDAVAKLLVDTHTVFQILFVRYAVQAIVLAPAVLLTGRTLAMTRRVFARTVLRTFLHMAAIAMMFTSLRYLPLADAIAIAYVEPFIMLVLGAWLLGEVVGSRRIAACVVGFAGTLLVVQPAFADVGLPALLPVGVAAAFAVFLIVTRTIAKEADPLALQAVSGLVATTVFAAALPVTGWAPIEPDAWPLLIAVGLLGTVAHLCMTWAMRFAPTVTLAPVSYLEIPFACLIGWAIFLEWPNTLAALGILITLAAGLYILHRERIAAHAI